MASRAVFPDGGIPPGQRIAVFGRAGSGKSYLTKWAILQSSAYRWVVLDTKHDPIFGSWNPRPGLQTMDQLHRLWKDHARVVIRPHPWQTKREVLDGYLMDLHEAFENFGTAIDETYQIAMGAHAGDGLTGLITRGRVRGQSMIMGSQRPARVPLFVFSEANGFVVMNLNLKKDRDRAYELTGSPRVLERVEPRHWLYYDSNDDRIRTFGPVTIAA